MRVFLVGIRHVDGLPFQVLAIHDLDCVVCTVEVVERDEPEVLRLLTLWVSHYLRREDNSELVEDISEHLLVNTVRQIPHEDVSSYLLCPLVLTGFINLDRFVEQFDHVQDLDGVVCVLLSLELDKAI